MIEQYFTQGMLLEPNFATALYSAMQRTTDATRFAGFVPGPRTIRVEGQTLTLNARANGSGGGAGYSVSNGICVLPVLGPLFSGMGEGFADPDAIAANLQAAVQDSSVKAVLMYCSTPGGACSGISALSDIVRSANRVKSIHVFVPDLCASAGMWIASGAAHITADRTAALGSVGVITSLSDYTGYLANLGIKIVNVATGAFKDVGSPARAMQQGDIDYIAGLIGKMFNEFVSAVAQGRNISEASIRAQQARVYVGTDAVKAGLADNIGSFDYAWGAIRSATDRNFRSAWSTGREAVHKQRVAEFANMTGESASEVEAGLRLRQEATQDLRSVAPHLRGALARKKLLALQLADMERN